MRVHLKPRIGERRLDRLRVSHLSEMFTAITDANVELLEQTPSGVRRSRSWRP